MDDEIQTHSQRIIASIDNALLRLTGMEAIISENHSDRQVALEDSVVKVQAALKNVDDASNFPWDAEVPVRLILWIDQGRDPDDFFRLLFKETVWDGQKMVGKLTALAKGKDELVREMKEKMPHAYRNFLDALEPVEQDALKSKS